MPATISSAPPFGVVTSVTTIAASTRLGLADGDVMAVEVLVVHAFDRILNGLLVVEGDEVEAPGPLGR
ncbi:unnamed protein product [Prunus armeniaca]|uniref:Uncharacterized protein n=1 Tax=Prunus armeniaca TaxID=36596 RepID=A0A6J5TJ75_PRUAR|nr:unnamed protein product [Prunus armeniaca]